MKTVYKMLALAVGAGLCTMASAADLSVISFGGANKDAQVKAWYERRCCSNQGTIRQFSDLIS